MNTTFICLLTTLFIAIPTNAYATSYAKPTDRMVASPNGKYTLQITAKSGLHELKSGDKVLWSFKRDVWHDDYFVSNDGRFVLWISDCYVGADDADKHAALKLYSAKGVVLSRTSAEVSTPRPYQKGEIGPIGDTWRIWRDTAIQAGDVVTIKTEGKPAYVVDFKKFGAKE